MRAKGATRRFDSLIEPQDGAANSNGVNGSRPSRAHGAHRKPTKGRQTKMLSAGVMTAAVVATAGILLLRSDPAARQDAPVDPTPASTAAPTTVPTAVPQPVAPPVESAPPVPLPPPAVTSAEVTRQPTVAIEPPVAPPPAPTTVTDAPEAGVPQPPTTRPPISVAPETRPPFPNQTPPEGGDRDRGGLLGGGGLL